MSVTLPPGFRLVYNRLDRKFERMFDGVPYPFDPHETLMLPEHIAEFVVAHSTLLFDPFTNESLHALVMDGDADFERPYEGKLGNELLSRDTQSYYLGNTGGVATHVDVMKVPGGHMSGPEGGRNVPLSTERL